MDGKGVLSCVPEEQAVERINEILRLIDLSKINDEIKVIRYTSDSFNVTEPGLELYHPKVQPRLIHKPRDTKYQNKENEPVM